MRILINTSKLRFGGAIQVALSFIYECRAFKEHEYHVFVGRGVARSLKKEDFDSNFTFYNFDFGTVTIWKTRGISSQLSETEKQIQPDCVITTSGPSYWCPKTPHLMGFNLGNYIYTDSPYYKTISWYTRLRLALKRKLHLWFFKRDASAFIVQTDDVNQRVRNVLNTDKVFTVSNTYNGFFDNFVRYDLNLPPKPKQEIWFLSIASYYKHKNLEIIPSVIKELSELGYHNVKFILTLDETTYRNRFKNLDVKNIINVGPIRPEECPSLYNQCDYSFLPSLVECFSASYPEAMVMEKPIITTDLPFARSICGDAAIYYKPMNSNSAAETIDLLLKDENLKVALIQNGLKRLRQYDTAGDRARKILEICENLRKTSLGTLKN